MHKIVSILLLILMTSAFMAEANLFSISANSDIKKEAAKDIESKKDSGDSEETQKKQSFEIKNFDFLTITIQRGSFLLSENQYPDEIMLDKHKRPPRN